MTVGAATAASQWEAQRSFDELGRPLRDITFCVVDLETTGGSAEAGSMITEIGAVKVRGGEVLGEFQTLVNPHTAIPAFIAVLTGITNSMVADAPSIDSALPAFLTCLVVLASLTLGLGDWIAWVEFLTANASDSARRVGHPLAPPLLVRLPIAVAMTVAAALTGRRWLVPVAMCVATPVFGVAVLTMLAAVPRLARETEPPEGALTHGYNPRD